MKTTQLLTRTTRILLSNTTRTTSRTLLRPTYTTLKTLTPTRHLSTTFPRFKGLQPDTEEPKAPSPTAHAEAVQGTEPAELTDSEYHEIADQYLNTLLLTLEEKAEDPKAGYEVEYSAGVLTLGTPKGTYVINKQPPNKQIWLSSPVSGPKRFDWVAVSEGQNQKEGTESEAGDGTVAGGAWVYLRDGSNMTELLREEIGVQADVVEDVAVAKEGPAGSG